MLTDLGRAVVQYRKWVLVASVIGFLYCGAIGGSVAKHLTSGGFDDPKAESTRAEHLIARTFGNNTPNLVLLVSAKHGPVDAPAVKNDGLALTHELAGEASVGEVVSYWSLGSPPPLRSKDGTRALVLARIGGSANHVSDVAKRLSPKYTRDDGTVVVGVGGFGEVFRQVGTQIEKDLRVAETLTLPLVLLLLIVVFGSAVAAGLPIAVGALAVVGTFFILRVLAHLTDVSIYSLNLTTGMGLGLAVDYSLFIVSRYREERANGRGIDAAIVRSVETAGRTVLFGALTVAAALAALLIFPLAFLRSFAYAGIGVVALAALGAIVFLPALLAVIGPGIDRLTLWRRHQAEVGRGFWHGLAMFVMRRPILMGGGVIVVLLVLGAPFLNVKFGLPDDRVLPKSASSRKVQDVLRSQFSSQETGATSVVAAGIGNPTARARNVDDYAARLSKLPSVARVDAVTGSYIGGFRVLGPSAISARFQGADATWFSVVPTVDPQSGPARTLVHNVRALARPFPVLVGGQSADLVDSEHSIFGRMPLAGAIIGVITFAMLFLFTGSVLVPIKALVLNLLSLTATFGAMAWIFQDGHLSGFFNFTATGNLDTTTPILMFCVAFGLSMDYEVFLLSRIKEEHDLTGDNVASVAVGLERTGRIVTAAAALLALVFIAFATSKITFIKLFGVGLALAVVMDATLVRAVLVPAFMRLAGNANWWAPKPLRRLYDRVGIHEGEVVAPPPRPELVGAAAEP